MDTVLGALSDGLTYELRSISISLSKQRESSSRSHSVQKHLDAPNTIDLRAELDVPAKMQFIGHNSLARRHQVLSIGLNKPKYCSKAFQEVKVV